MRRALTGAANQRIGRFEEANMEQFLLMKLAIFLPVK